MPPVPPASCGAPGGHGCGGHAPLRRRPQRRSSRRRRCRSGSRRSSNSSRAAAEARAPAPSHRAAPTSAGQASQQVEQWQCCQLIGAPRLNPVLFVQLYPHYSSHARSFGVAPRLQIAWHLADMRTAPTASSPVGRGCPARHFLASSARWHLYWLCMRRRWQTAARTHWHMLTRCAGGA